MKLRFDPRPESEAATALRAEGSVEIAIRCGTRKAHRFRSSSVTCDSSSVLAGEVHSFAGAPS